MRVEERGVEVPRVVARCDGARDVGDGGGGESADGLELGGGEERLVVVALAADVPAERGAEALNYPAVEGLEGLDGLDGLEVVPQTRDGREHHVVLARPVLDPRAALEAAADALVLGGDFEGGLLVAHVCVQVAHDRRDDVGFQVSSLLRDDVPSHVHAHHDVGRVVLPAEEARARVVGAVLQHIVGVLHKLGPVVRAHG